MKSDVEYIIVGGGIAGLSMAIALQNINKDFLLFEQSSEIRGLGAGFGLAANAMQAFDLMGMKEEVEQIGFYTDSYKIFDQYGKTLLDPDTKSLSISYHQKNFTVHRADLHRLLISKIDPKKIYAGKKCTSIIQNTDSIVVCFDDQTQACGKFLLAADGIKSQIRQLLLPKSRPRYAGYTCWRATISNQDINLSHGSETWGRRGRFGMTPLVGNRIYWYACVNTPAPNSSLKNYQVSDLLENFREYHRPIPEILSATSDAVLIWNDILDIAPIDQFAFGNILLLGDAAHATTPNLGQGACQALGRCGRFGGGNLDVE